MTTPNTPLDHAKWICPKQADYLHNTQAQYRRDFELARVPRKAPFHITADQSYMLYVNGHYVGRGPARGYQSQWPFDSYDIAKWLNKGANFICVRHYNGGISTFGYIFEWRAGMLCAAKWPGFELISDEKWISRVSPAYRPDTKRVSVQLNLQEHADARLDNQKWISSPKVPRNWTDTTTAIPYGSMPWHSVEARGIPNLTSNILSYQKAVCTTTGPCNKNYELTTDVVAHMRQELDKAKWHAAGKAKCQSDGLQVTLKATGKGKITALTVDLGMLSVGSLRIEARGAKGGEHLDLHFCEVLHDNNAPLLEPLSMGARLILDKGKTEHELFQIMGHRYLTLVLRESQSDIKLKLALRETIYPMDIKGGFECDDETLNDIHKICVRTQEICSLDSYVDTPWREQAQWWGDARVQAANTFILANDTRLLARGIRSIARQNVPNGLTYGHAPTNCHAAVLPDFSITWVMTIWDYYYQCGDISLFTEQLPRIDRVLNYFETEGLGANGLLRYDRRYWLFLDWSTLPKIETPTLLNMWYLIMLERLAKLCRISRQNKRAAEFTKKARVFKQRIEKSLWDDKTGLFCDGLDKKGRPAKSWSVHSQCAAIMCGLKKSKLKNLITNSLLPYLRGEKLNAPVPSSFWVHYVYEIMTQAGYGREVVEHIRLNYAPMIPYGGVWEVFAWQPGKGSTSHAWAAHPIKHLSATLGGIMQNDVAWKNVIYSPVTDTPGINRSNVVIPTPAGLIKSGWTKKDAVVELKLSLPKGVTARCELPGLKGKKLTGNSTLQIRQD